MKRRFRPEVGELGYVGGEYTKTASAGRAEYERKLAEQRTNTVSDYMRPEDLLLAGRRAAASSLLK